MSEFFKKVKIDVEKKKGEIISNFFDGFIYNIVRFEMEAFDSAFCQYSALYYEERSSQFLAAGDVLVSVRNGVYMPPGFGVNR
jgi:hypothetical protein